MCPNQNPQPAYCTSSPTVHIPAQPPAQCPPPHIPPRPSRPHRRAVQLLHTQHGAGPRLGLLARPPGPPAGGPRQGVRQPLRRAPKRCRQRPVPRRARPARARQHAHHRLGVELSDADLRARGTAKYGGMVTCPACCHILFSAPSPCGCMSALCRYHCGGRRCEQATYLDSSPSPLRQL